MSHLWTVTLFALPLYLLSTAAIAVDQNSNGLSDVWEQRFNASALQLLNDDDGDGFTNVEECIVGTDPEDASDLPRLLPSTTQNDPDQIELRFQTLSGKHYSVTHSPDLNDFTPISKGWLGDNTERPLHIGTDGIAATLSPIRIDYWANFAGTTIEELHALNTFPSAPDGSSNHPAPEAPDFLASGYGARLSCWITPPESGSYTLFLSAGGPAELYLHDTTSSSAPVKIAEILPTQTDLSSGEWDTYATQRSTLLELSADTRYALELHYVANVPQQYAEIAWSGPSIDGIQQLDRDALAQVFFHNQLGPQNILLQHDYDSDGQTGAQWPDNTAIVTDIIGMTGNAEQITGDVGTSSTLERIYFDPGSSEHFYATWLFNMSSGQQDTYMFFMNGTDSSQEGPRIDIEDSTSNSTGAAVRAGGSGGSDVQIDINFEKTYRIELIASLAVGGFEYKTPNETHTVAEDTFDLYVTDLTGNLVGAHTGLVYRDGAVVEKFSSLRLPYLNNPNIVFDDWEFTNGLIAGNGYLISNQTDFGNGDTPNFFELEIKEQDQDNDGIPDWEELALAPYYPFLPFDAETQDGLPDADALALLLAQSQGKPEITLYGSDGAAFESNYPNTTPDNGEITITRAGTLEPLIVDLCFPPLEAGTSTTLCDGTCCMLIGSAGDEEAEPEDYILTDEDGTIVTDTVHFAFGEIKKVLTLTPVDDTLNEYPESVNIAIKEADDARYDVSELLNGASIQIFDLPDSPDNITIFTGSFSQDGKAVVPTSGSGYATATINGPRTEIRLWDEFSGLTSAQQDSHVHKANAGNTAGNIIYAITETPGDDESDPLNGPLTNYLWDLTDSSGAVPTAGGPASKQVIIDSLFGQNNETPLYLNVHTVDNPAGEIWAFLNLSGGSATDPGDAPAAAATGSGEFPQLTGDLLESEVRRFLNQATFGATDSEVAAFVAQIENQRLSNPAYHRNEAYSDWIDTQMTTANTPQTYLLDFTLAAVFQRMTLAGLFDASRNPTDGTTATPSRPTWPSIDRSSSNPEHWYLSAKYPVTHAQLNLGDNNNLSIGTTTGNAERRNAHWQTMLNARDQLRQKMGYALQQIVVVSASSTSISQNAYAASNYQDMLNTHAFGYYRDVLGYVNWSPVMGKWLSSLQNQKAIDFDGDGLFDAYPDENLARENMQLFSIGLFNIWSDGTLKLTPEGLPSSTYTNDDIREFAKILTGQSFSQYASTTSTPAWGGVPYAPSDTSFSASQNTSGQLSRSYLYPMKMFGDYHSLGSKSFAGTTIDHSDITDPELQGIADIEAAIDWLAGTPGDGQPDFDMVHSHVSTPAFISRRLIQRFTTSNPSQDYLHRVATVFKNSEGNLALTLKAILLDPEARNINLNDTRFGMKKSPLEGYLQLLRTLQAHTYLPLTNPEGAAPYDVAAGDYSNPDIYLENFKYPSAQLANFERNVRFAPGSTFTSGTRGLQMDPFTQETVFNFYLPDFSPGGAVGAAGMVAPELQLANEPDVIRNINYFEYIIRYSQGPGGDELGGTDTNQELAFNSVDADRHDYQRLDRQALADAFYPATEPTSELTLEGNGLTDGFTGTYSAEAPHWVRLNRTGDVFIASESVDGVTWTEIATQVLPMASEVYIGLALTSHDDGILTTAEFSNVSITSGEGTWYHSDIGNVAAEGSTVANSETAFTLEASGNDIWNSADEFHYAYQQLDGDGEIIARVDSLVLTNPWAKAGVMIRETLDANSANVISLISGSYGTRAQMRSVPRGRSSESLADEALVDELDRRLTYGFFKLRYPYDTSDNDDPNIYGVDETLKNPRELIIDAITNGYGDPFDGSNDETDRLYKFADALYLLTFSPEYQIKK
ncbi:MULTISPECIES: DUF1800 family protein [unclassified Lentimonas]|uniref:DUF1800 family protein n=1 Tax=unclassified Lentimonas TaxID=2630993 RepID=UPI001320AC0D|nr:MULTISPECIES: DUF1800 family protein [unclassified Lentimonas]CAA6676700.1 Unannotated [Lentimonas sp. CC4]CAA6684635.1 Unannotated [Lentimonas sp. CC6]CAA7075271.1 Unannotated [Lentimonas sp. CC4]CAA7170656.1 Unannotated [Lentimonas sp. CC21]CAA7182321.1 Unannotated [Lentimonas sp. CC8]